MRPRPSRRLRPSVGLRTLRRPRIGTGDRDGARRTERLARRPRVAAAALVAASLLVASCDRSRDEGTAGGLRLQPSVARTVQAPTRPPTGVAPTRPASTAFVTGRLVDAVTGLPVPDAGVALLGLDRRTISGADGRYRFDGVPTGAGTVVVGPVADYVPRSVGVHVEADGVDLGLTALLPAGPPTLIVPDYGGVVAGCEGTAVRFATRAVPEPTPVRATCLQESRSFPAPPPSGRLPLAVVDLSPESLLPSTPASLEVGLPEQPRYSEGVALDLLRLDLARLVWVPTGTLVVGAGSEAASGPIDALGTYMVAAPPYGALLDSGGSGPSVQQFGLSAATEGPPAAVFPVGTVIVYALFDYVRANDTPVTVRTISGGGTAVFESTRPYTGAGRDHVPMVAGGGSWPAGTYQTTLYLGEPPVAVHTIDWRVAAAPTPVPPMPTVPAVPTALGGRRSTAVPVPPPPSGCRPPAGWYAYVVRPGDTLTALAWRTGTSVERIRTANCLTGDRVLAGAVLYLPAPPAREPAPAPLPTYPRPATPWPPPAATLVPWPEPTRPGGSPIPPWPVTPTTWYTPPPPPTDPPPPTEPPAPTPPPPATQDPGAPGTPAPM